MSTKLSYRVLILTGLLMLVFQGLSYSQNLSASTIKTIEKDISRAFDKSIKAGESFDISNIENSTDDTLKCGFLDNGIYFSSFEDVMKGYKIGVQGLKSQDLTVINKKITVLSKDKALLTASGDFTATVNDGRVLKGKFAWSFVYSKIKGEWKVIHSHMSNP